MTHSNNKVALAALARIDKALADRAAEPLAELRSARAELNAVFDADQGSVADWFRAVSAARRRLAVAYGRLGAHLDNLPPDLLKEVARMAAHDACFALHAAADRTGGES